MHINEPAARAAGAVLKEDKGRQAAERRQRAGRAQAAREAPGQQQQHRREPRSVLPSLVNSSLKDGGIGGTNAEPVKAGEPAASL